MPVKILMVCLGNICRSPLAEGILSSKLPKDKFQVDSAGTGSWHIGHQPDQRSIAVAKKNNLDISGQKARKFQVSDFDTFDYIYVMDKSNYKDVISLSKNKKQKDKVQLIMNEQFSDKDVNVPDPYYGFENDFDTVYKMIDKACNSIAQRLIEKYT